MKKIKVYHSKDQNLEYPDISSAIKYDQHLVHAFPHYAYVTYGEGRHFAGLIAGGIHKINLYGYPSFALTLDYGTTGKVLWLSDSALMLLDLLADNYEFEDINRKEMFNGTPTHKVEIR